MRHWRAADAAHPLRGVCIAPGTHGAHAGPAAGGIDRRVRAAVLLHFENDERRSDAVVVGD